MLWNSDMHFNNNVKGTMILQDLHQQLDFE